MISQIKNEFKRVNFIEDAFKTISDVYIPKLFSAAFENNESLNDFYCLEEQSQVGVQLTAQISHAFYSYLKYDANKNLISQNSFLRVITDRKVGKQKSYDLVFKNIETQELYYVEVKLSQNNNSWQGSTSTTSKVDLFLLINFRIDRNSNLRCLENNLFTGLFASIVDMKNKAWRGEAKSNNHRTKFEFRIEDWDIDKLITDSIIIGGLTKKKSIAHLILEEITW